MPSDKGVEDRYIEEGKGWGEGRSPNKDRGVEAREDIYIRVVFMSWDR